MGRRNKAYAKTLHQQAYERLTGMLKAGEGRSKKEAILSGTDKDKIFCYGTYATYWRHTKYFLRWISRKYPDCTTLSKAKEHVHEWLEERTASPNRYGKPMSAWTMQTEAAAMNKLFGIRKDDPDRFQPPQRKRYNITRSRLEVKNDRHFSEANNAELINFCRGTGCRRNVLKKLEKDDLWSRERMETELSKLIKKQEARGSTLARTLSDALNIFPDQDCFIHHQKDKNGKYRFAPVIGPHKADIIRRFEETRPGKKVWEHVHSAADIHGYRGDYAMRIYKYYARDIDEIPFDRIHPGLGYRYQSQVYICRSDEAGKRLDKAAMLKASKSLGHNRLDVVADHYLRGL